MSYKVENLENSMAKITIEVSPEAFEEAMKKSYNKNKNKIALPSNKSPQIDCPGNLPDNIITNSRQNANNFDLYPVLFF